MGSMKLYIKQGAQPLSSTPTHFLPEVPSSTLTAINQPSPSRTHPTLYLPFTPNPTLEIHPIHIVILFSIQALSSFPHSDSIPKCIHITYLLLYIHKSWIQNDIHKSCMYNIYIHTLIYPHTYTHTHIYIYIYIYIYIFIHNFGRARDHPKGPGKVLDLFWTFAKLLFHPRPLWRSWKLPCPFFELYEGLCPSPDLYKGPGKAPVLSRPFEKGRHFV